MIQHPTKNTMVTNNTNATQSYTIDVSNGKAYQILADGIYRYKIAAIVRELMANCYDAHVMAGKGDVPFRIKKPTAINPVIEFEDFGTGLGPDAIQSIYTSFFTSTKGGSNEVIGALGLGSKTPLAYTQGFTVRDRKDGNESIYTIYKGDDGVPSFSLISSKDTDQGNGICVSIPVKNDDFREFEYLIDFYSQFYIVAPDVVPEPSGQFNSIRENLDRSKAYSVIPYNRRTPDLYEGDTLALMGSVPYPITVNASKMDATDYEIFRFLSNAGQLVFHYDIGDLDISASRESLSEDPQTREVLYHQIKWAMKDKRQEYEDEYEAASTPQELYQFYNKDSISRALMIEKDRAGLLSQKGVGVFTEVKKFSETHPILHRMIYTHDLYGTRLFTEGTRKKKIYRHDQRRMVSNEYLLTGGKITFITNSKKTSSGMVKASQAYSAANEDEVVICLLKPLKACLKEALRRDLDFAEVKFIDFAMLKPTVQKTPKVKKEDNQVTACTFYRGEYIKSSNVTVDDPERFRYVNRDGMSEEILIDGAYSRKFSTDDLAEVMKTFFDPSVTLLYRNSTNASRIDKMGIKPLSDDIKALKESHDISQDSDISKKVRSMLYCAKGRTCHTTGQHDRMIDKVHTYAKCGAPEAEAYLSSVMIERDGQVAARNYLRAMATIHGAGYVDCIAEKDYDELQLLIEKLGFKYPMLDSSTATMTNKMEYISMVNAQKGDSNE